jgi:hypothetical protein
MNIFKLHRELCARFPSVHQPPSDLVPFPTGLGPLDDIGIPKAAITEITSRHPTCGSGLLIHCLIHASVGNRHHLALIDGADSFAPQSPAPSLLWIRCQKTEHAPKAADLLLRDGNLPLVLMDLQLSPRREVQGIPSSTWFRLRNLAEQSGTALLAFTSTPLIPASRLRLELSHRFTLQDLDLPPSQLLPQLHPQIIRHHCNPYFLNQQATVA